MTTLVLQQKSVKPSFSGSVIALTVVLQRWIERHQQRKQLAQLESHQLKDIGLNIAQQQQEVNKPFWK